MARHHERWRADWRRGLVLAADLALALTLCAIQCCVGFFFGERRWSWLLGVASFYGVVAT